MGALANEGSDIIIHYCASNSISLEDWLNVAKTRSPPNTLSELIMFKF